MGLSAALSYLTVAAFVSSFLHHMGIHQWLVSVLKVRSTAYSMMLRTRPPSVTEKVAAVGLRTSGYLTHRVSADSPFWRCLNVIVWRLWTIPKSIGLRGAINRSLRAPPTSPANGWQRRPCDQAVERHAV